MLQPYSADQEPSGGVMKIPAANRDAQGSGSSTAISSNEGTHLVEALEKYKNELTPFEKIEIRNFNTIHTIGTVRIEKQAQFMGTDGNY
jgi:hypothetical protein